MYPSSRDNQQLRNKQVQEGIIFSFELKTIHQINEQSYLLIQKKKKKNIESIRKLNVYDRDLKILNNHYENNWDMQSAFNQEPVNALIFTVDELLQKRTLHLRSQSKPVRIV